MLRIFFGVLSLVVFLIACEQSNSSYLPGYSGNSGEIILVINDSHFEQAKETVYQTIGRYQHGLPQQEQVFSIVNIPHKNFSQIFKVNRNIIVADIAPNNVQSVEIKKNQWAKEQLVVHVTAGSVETFKKLLFENSDELLYKFQNIEIKRLINRNLKFGLEKSLDRHHLKLTLQEGAGIVMDSSDVVWIRLERERPVGGTMHQISQGLLIYHRPYNDTLQFNSEELIKFKDAITKKYIPGPLEGSFMTTSKKYILPMSKPVTLNGRYAVRTTGLWRMQNAHMGGPFVSLTVLDEKRARLVTIEGYVFAPQFNKREFLREVEAMARSVSFY